MGPDALVVSWRRALWGGFGDVLADDVQWVFSAKQGYCKGIKFVL